MRGKSWIVPAVVVLLLIGAHFAYWHYLQDRLAAGFADWVQARRAAGWTVSTGAERRHGWPLSATLSIGDIALRGAASDLPGGLDWQTPRLDLRIDLLAPGRLALRARGTQHLRIGRLPALAITAARITGEMPLTGDPASPAGSLTARDLRGRLDDAPATGASEDRGAVTVGLVQIVASSNAAAAAGGAAITWRFATEAIALPPDRVWALGSRISSLSIEGALDGPLPPPGSLLARATAWRDGGGKVEIHDMATGWGPLGASGTATLALDDRLQPAGTAQMRLVGYDATLDALAAGDVIPPGAALATKAVLSLLAEPSQPDTPQPDTPQQGTAEAATVPLTLQDRTLSMRGLPIARLPELIWPAP